MEQEMELPEEVASKTENMAIPVKRKNMRPPTLRHQRPSSERMAARRVAESSMQNRQIESRDQRLIKTTNYLPGSFARSGEPMGRRTLKIPEALPDESIKESKLKKITSRVFRKKVAIQEIVREPTSGGIVFRLTADQKDIEFLLIQDSKGRWTIPKGHIEPGETAKMTARREVEEETGLKNIDILTWLGKIHFKYRRGDKLVLMTTQIYLIQAMDMREMPTGEKWMRGIKWFPFSEALDLIEYEDIEKIMIIAKKKIRAGDF